MAMAARSIWLSFRDESVGNACVRSGLANVDRFHRKKALHFRVVVVKLWPSTSKRSRHLHLNTSGRDFFGLGSRWSRVLFSRRTTEEISSSFSITSTNKSEVIP